MIFLVLGAGTLLVLMGALGAFSRARVETIKALGVWIAAIGGLLLAALLLLTGRGPTAIAGLLFLGPLVWSWFQPPALKQPPGSRPSAGFKRSASGTRSGPIRRSGGMTADEALAVLGLPKGATNDDVVQAHRRLMRAAHPDAGGSDWLASQVNQARDVLLP